jgi:hypothetical protein
MRATARSHQRQEAIHRLNAGETQADIPRSFNVVLRRSGGSVVGEQGRGTRHCRSRQRQHDRADAKKNILQPHRRQQWVIPPKANSAFVAAAMEDGLAEENWGMG